MRRSGLQPYPGLGLCYHHLNQAISTPFCAIDTPVCSCQRLRTLRCLGILFSSRCHCLATQQWPRSATPTPVPRFLVATADNEPLGPRVLHFFLQMTCSGAVEESRPFRCCVDHWSETWSSSPSQDEVMELTRIIYIERGLRKEPLVATKPHSSAHLTETCTRTIFSTDAIYHKEHS